MLCIPTASGKSLVAYIGIINQLKSLNPGSRGIYIVPLKALASEKLEELKHLGERSWFEDRSRHWRCTKRN